jgi:nucleotide-binding universal stress UspA family protein
MYRNMMVPIDGSDWSRHAIPLALAVARPARATLHLVSVLDAAFDAPIYAVPIASVGPAGGVLLNPDILTDTAAARREVNEAALRTFAERLGADTGVTVTASLEEGDIVGALRRYAEVRDIDLVVMATHGRTGLARAVLGSVADALLHAIPCPMLLARPHGELTSEHEPASITHLLVPLDGSVQSDAIVSDAAELAALTGARGTLLNVSHPELLSGIAAPEALLDPAAKQRSDHAETAHLERMAELFRAHSSRVSVVTLREQTPTDAIVDYAATHAVDLIAMTTHARHGLARMMLGSTATALLHRTRLPMLLKRSDIPTTMPTA